MLARPNASQERMMADRFRGLCTWSVRTLRSGCRVFRVCLILARRSGVILVFGFLVLDYRGCRITPSANPTYVSSLFGVYREARRSSSPIDSAPKSQPLNNSIIGLATSRDKGG